MDPEFTAILLALLAANSGLWRVLDHYVLGRNKCGSEGCNKAVVNALKKDITEAPQPHNTMVLK